MPKIEARDRTAQCVLRTADEVEGRALAFERGGSGLRNIGDGPHAGDDRRRRDRAAGSRLVVQADVAGDERRAEFAACVREAVDGRNELREVFRLFGIAEIQTVGQSGRRCADRYDVAHGFAHRELRRSARVELSVTRIPVDREGAAERRPRNRDDDARVGISRRDRCRPAHDAVVTRKDRLARAHVVMTQNEFDHVGDVDVPWLFRLGRWRKRSRLPLVTNAAGEKVERHVHQLAAFPARDVLATIGNGHRSPRHVRRAGPSAG